MPAPLVAEMLGYSDKVAQKHAAEAGNTWAKYVRPDPQGQDASEKPDFGDGSVIPLLQRRAQVVDAGETTEHSNNVV